MNRTIAVARTCSADVCCAAGAVGRHCASSNRSLSHPGHSGSSRIAPDRAAHRVGLSFDDAARAGDVRVNAIATTIDALIKPRPSDLNQSASAIQERFKVRCWQLTSKTRSHAINQAGENFELMKCKSHSDFKKEQSVIHNTLRSILL